METKLSADAEVGNLAVGDHPPDCLGADAEEECEFPGCEDLAAFVSLVGTCVGRRLRTRAAGAHDDHVRRRMVFGNRVLGLRFARSGQAEDGSAIRALAGALPPSPFEVCLWSVLFGVCGCVPPKPRGVALGSTRLVHPAPSLTWDVLIGFIASTSSVVRRPPALRPVVV